MADDNQNNLQNQVDAELNQNNNEYQDTNVKNIRQVTLKSGKVAFIPIIGQLTFKSRSHNQKVVFSNPEKNSDELFLYYELYVENKEMSNLSDEGKEQVRNNAQTSLNPPEDYYDLIYSSKSLLPGNDTDKIKIAETLSKGTYQGFIRYKFKSYLSGEESEVLDYILEPVSIKVKRNLLPFILILLVILLFAGIIFGLNNIYQKNAKTVEEGGIVLDTTDSSSKGPSTQVKAPMYAERHIKANEQTVEMSFYNPKENEDSFYLEFVVTLHDTGEEIYRSNLLKPGEAIMEITLNRPLPAGEYDADMTVNPYRMDDEMTPIANKAANPFKIVAE